MLTPTELTKFQLTKDNCVALLVDIQDNLIPVMHNSAELIQSTEILLNGMQTLAIPLITTEQYPKGLGHTIQALQPYVANGDLFEKSTFSSLTEEVTDKLASLNKSHVILFGVETHICVLQTARSLVSLGYNVHLVSECVSSRTQANKDNGINIMRQMGVVITNLETCLFDILHNSKAPEFKTISKLIK